MKYFISILLVVFCGVISAQEVTPGPYIPPPAETGNTIFSTVNPPPEGAQYQWSGFIPTQSNGGGLSGGNIPGYNTFTGTFLFGYTQGVVNYSTAVNYALRNAGLGIQVTGFRYSWEYFNQDFSRGSLSANVSLTAPNKSILESYNYDLPKTTNGWTMMSGVETFSNPYAPQSLGDLRVSFTGKDDRFWAGYYGPQIRQFDVRLLYNPTPPPPPEYLRWVKIADEWGTFTVNEPTTVRYGAEGTYLYATFQPGTYACNNFEWGKDPIGGVYKSCSLGTNTALPAPKPATTTADLTTTTTNTIIAAAAEPVTTTTTTTAPTATTAISEPVTTVTVSSTGISATTTTTASASNTSPAGAITVVREEAAVSRESTERTASGPALSSVLANIRSNQDRQNSIAMSAVASSIEVANSVTQKAEQLAVEAASTSAQQAMQTAQNSGTMGGTRSTANMAMMENNRQSTTASNNQVNVLQGMTNSSAVFDLFARPESKNITPSAVAMIDYSLRPQTNIATSTYVAPSLSLIRPESRPIETIVDNQFSIQEVKPILRQPVIEIFSNNNTASISNSTIIFGKRGDPIQDYIEANNAMFNEMKNESRPTTARINVQDNELAGGVKIERMAIVPNGFSVYTSFMLTNIAFYEPKEIYKNNVPKDNVRSMYFLEKGNTDTFNKMIEGQYR